jgi:Tfp pilus assembly protein PilN
VKILSRDFTRTEKILIAVLALILLGLFYYQFVEKTVRQSIANAQSDAQMLQTELDAAQARLMAANNIKNSMDALEASGQKSWMGSYNNSRAEVAFLNTILADTLQYSVTFSNVTRAGNQIRRSFTLEYRTGSYASAHEIMARLSQSHDRCLVSDASCSMENDGTVVVRQAATFYETMVGGVPDAGLPADSAAANS